MSSEPGGLEQRQNRKISDACPRPLRGDPEQVWIPAGPTLTREGHQLGGVGGVQTKGWVRTVAAFGANLRSPRWDRGETWRLTKKRGARMPAAHAAL